MGISSRYWWQKLLQRQKRGGKGVREGNPTARETQGRPKERLPEDEINLFYPALAA
jgi:hypothetical protein